MTSSSPAEEKTPLVRPLPFFSSASKSSGVSQTLSYVWAAARRKTCSRSRSCFLPGRWRALEQSSSPVPGWSAGPPCAPGSAAAAHTCASPAGGEKTSGGQNQFRLKVSPSGSRLDSRWSLPPPITVGRGQESRSCRPHFRWSKAFQLITFMID